MHALLFVIQYEKNVQKSSENSKICKKKITMLWVRGDSFFDFGTN